MKAKILSANTIQIVPEDVAEESVLENWSMNNVLRQSKGWDCGGYSRSRLTHINITSYPQPDKSEDATAINIIGWFAVFNPDGEIMCIWPAKEDIPIGLQLYDIRQITAKVDFTFEQIQAELSKRVDKVQAVCFENPKL